ncbi:MAG: hypothetical protein AAF532_02270 [Planctomycetota bacterium]
MPDVTFTIAADVDDGTAGGGAALGTFNNLVNAPAASVSAASGALNVAFFRLSGDAIPDDATIDAATLDVTQSADATGLGDFAGYVGSATNPAAPTDFNTASDPISNTAGTLLPIMAGSAAGAKQFDLTSQIQALFTGATADVASVLIAVAPAQFSVDASIQYANQSATLTVSYTPAATGGGSGGPTDVPAEISENVLSEYLFDEDDGVINTADALGNSEPFVVTGTPTPATFGDLSMVVIKNQNDRLEIAGGDNPTFNMRAYPDGHAVEFWLTIEETDNARSNLQTDWVRVQQRKVPTPRFRLNRNPATASYDRVVAPVAGETYHIVIATNLNETSGQYELAFYVSPASGSVDSSPTTVTNFNDGNWPTDPGTIITGESSGGFTIGPIRTYSAVLSPASIEWLYNGGAGRPTVIAESGGGSSTLADGLAWWFDFIDGDLADTAGSDAAWAVSGSGGPASGDGPGGPDTDPDALVFTPALGTQLTLPETHTQFADSGDFTFAFWFRGVSDSIDRIFSVFTPGGWGGNANYVHQLIVRQSPHRLEYTGGTPSITRVIQVDCGTLGEWHRGELSRVGGDLVLRVRSATVQNEGTESFSGLLSFADEWQVGRVNSSSSSPNEITGYRAWDRALTAAERDEDWNNGAGVAFASLAGGGTSAGLPWLPAYMAGMSL